MSEEKNPIQKTKAELFAEDPDRFIDGTEIIFGVSRHPETKGLGHYVNIGHKGESLIDVYEEALKIKAFVEHKMNMFLFGIEAQIAERNKVSKIVTPGRFMEGIRHLKNGRH